MFGLKKNTPVVLFFFALILLFLPDRWLTQPELLFLSFLKPVNYLLADSADDTASDKIKILEKKVSELTAELQESYNENRRLTKQLQEVLELAKTQPPDFKLQNHYQLIPANTLIQRDISGWRHALVLDRGSSDGITLELPVVSGKYLVGKISRTGPFTSEVVLITDPAFRVKAHAAMPPAPVSPTEQVKSPPAGSDKIGTGSSPDKQTLLTSAEGVLEGFSARQTSLKWVSRDVPVQPGWLVFTSFDFYRMCPQGLLIGTVASVQEEGYFSRLTVEPILDINNLSSVIVLKKK